jgi:hypothetical protein
MSATAVVVSVSVVIILMIAKVVTLLWRTRVGGRRRETPEARYRREMTDLRPTAQTWRAKRADRTRQRKIWAAGSAGAVGTYYGGSGGGSCGGGSSCGGGGCGGGGCGGGGS